MARKIAAAVFSLGCIHTSATMALGLGELSLDSFLNEPLKARVDLLDAAGLNEDQVKIRLATKEDFQRLGVDRAYFLTGISFEVVIDGKGQGKILITSEDPVLEPYLDFIVEARWPAGRLLREYTVLVDPPVFDESTTVVSASDRVAALDGGAAPSGGAPSGSRQGGSAANAPASGYGAGAAGAPAPGSRYQISRNDTLWEIASAARPQGASVHQTMLDIQRLNPDAFIDGNINRIKAGYVVYLPDSSEISSVNEAAVIEEIRQQNQAWREQTPTQSSVVDSGPALRLSAEPDEFDNEGGAASDAAALDRRVAAATSALQENLEKSELEKADSERRLAAVQEQLDTLEQIVSVKDDQIAALQAALAEAGVSPLGVSAQDADAESAADTDLGQTTDQTVADTTAVQQTAANGPSADAAAAAAKDTVDVDAGKDTGKQVTPSRAADSGATDGLPGWLGYAAGALVLGGGGAWWLRRRRNESTQADGLDADDVFADVELSEEPVEFKGAVPEAEAVASDPQPRDPLDAEEAAEIDQPEDADPSGENRGYGERKHDEYASDDDAGDALAEADIYMAYGRYPQAVELLNNALRGEPDNAAFRLKLVELYAELGDSKRAQEHLDHLRRVGSQEVVSQAEQAFRKIGATNVTQLHPSGAPEGDTAVDLPPPGLDLDDFESDSQVDTGASVLPDLMVDGGDSLGADFSGLEIEDGAEASTGDLDLSVDFDREGTGPDQDGEDMVFAAEGSEMSTKLDLARAYMDMGDEEGAKQILEEVASEGSEDQREEAKLLLQRVG